MVRIILIKKQEIKPMKNFFIAIIFICVISCEKESKSDCNVENPLEDYAWLSEMKTSLPGEPCPFALAMGRYHNNIVFYTLSVGPACNTVFGVDLLNCNGDVVKQYSEVEYEQFEREVEFIKFL